MGPVGPTHTEEHAPRSVSCRAAGEASLGNRPARRAWRPLVFMRASPCHAAPRARNLWCILPPVFGARNDRVHESTARVIPSEGEESLGKHPARLCVPGSRVHESTARNLRSSTAPVKDSRRPPTFEPANVSVLDVPTALRPLQCPYAPGPERGPSAQEAQTTKTVTHEQPVIPRQPAATRRRSGPPPTRSLLLLVEHYLPRLHHLEPSRELAPAR